MASDRRLFWRQFREAFHTTGAIVPSSRWLAAELCRFIPGRGDDRPGRLLLEVGPGEGAVTDQLLRRVGPADRLDLVEVNDAFVARIRERLDKEPHWRAVADRVRVFHLPLETFTAEAPYDAIVSGLPLNNFSPAVVATILDRFAAILRAGGMVSYFEYLAIRSIKRRVGAATERPRLTQLDELLSAALADVEFEQRRVWWNLPPAVVHHCRFPADWRAPVVNEPLQE